MGRFRLEKPRPAGTAGKKGRPAGSRTRQELKKNSSSPLYVQLARLIREDITSGKLQRGDTLPTEIELTQLYGVSRITVRGALSILVKDGLIYRQKGKGTVVKQAKLTRQAPGLLGIHEEIRATGRRPETRLVSFEILIDPPAEVKRSLNLKEGEETICIRRNVYADDELLGVSRAYIPGPIWSKVGLWPERLSNQSLYHLLDRAGYPLYEAEETIEVITADSELAAGLKVRRGFPLFCLTRTVYTKEGLPIEWGQNILRADKYQFRMHHWRER
ncbi:MAG: GntR family transcriptional regulator [Thermodesulfobacteriota bacterium]